MRAARVHRGSRRRGCAWPLAARAQQRASACGAIGVLHDRCTDGRSASISRPALRGVSLQGVCRDNWAGSTAATCGSISAGPRAMPSACRNTRRNWSRSRRTSSWPLAARRWRPLLQATRTIPIVFARSSPIRSAPASSPAWRGRAATSPALPMFEYSMSGEMAGAAQGDRAARDARGGPPGSRQCRRDRRSSAHDPGRGAVASGMEVSPINVRDAARDRARPSAAFARSRPMAA